MKLSRQDSLDFGLLGLRAGIGLMFVFVHGLPKVMGGVSIWFKLGGAFNRLLGLAFIPTFWGFMATAAEFGGGFLLALGLFFRPAAGLILFTVTIASLSILRGGYGLGAASQPIELGIVTLALLFTGPGRFTISSRFLHSKQKGHHDSSSEKIHR